MMPLAAPAGKPPGIPPGIAIPGLAIAFYVSCPIATDAVPERVSWGKFWDVEDVRTYIFAGPGF
jgi:hypothetical protein